MLLIIGIVLEPQINLLYDRFNEVIEFLSHIFESYYKIGRKVTDGNFESRFNRVVFEVQCFYFMNLDISTLDKHDQFVQNFIRLSSNDTEFRTSIESSTKNIDSYRIRYSKFQELINNSYNLNLEINPFN